MKPELGVQPNDGLAEAAMAEMKVDYERLKKVVCETGQRGRFKVLLE